MFWFGLLLVMLGMTSALIGAFATLGIGMIHEEQGEKFQAFLYYVFATVFLIVVISLIFLCYYLKDLT